MLFRSVSISDTGAVALTELDSFDADKYNHKDQLVRTHWVPYGGVTTTSDNIRMVCMRRKEHWEVRPAQPAPTPDNDVMLPEQKQPIAGAGFASVGDVDCVLVAPNGATTAVSLGDYMPWVFNDSRAESYSPSFPTKLLKVAMIVSPRRIAYVRSEPFCQYAVGMMAVLVTLKSQFMSSVRSLRVAVVDVATGAVVQLSPVIANVSSDNIARITMTCYEQALLDGDGAIVTHGKLLLSMNGYDNSDSRSDGFFTVSELTTLSWVAKEPSNTWGVYIGNAFAPAEIGVRMNLDDKSTPALR